MGGNAAANNGAGNRAMDASASLGNLYPQYLSTAKAFRCPSTEDEPVFTATVVDGGLYAVSNRTWALGYTAPTWPSYGYDPRIVPSAVSNHAILADMDGTYATNKDTSTQNHDGGQNVLYVDGHVSWTGANYVSNDPNDNIFTEAYKPNNTGSATSGFWHADTDAFMVRGSIAPITSYTYLEGSSLW
jgi:prepilin-type processing-associated H-X9-DG protein